MRFVAAVILTIILSLALFPRSTAAQGQADATARPLDSLEWTNHEGASFRGRLEGFDYENKLVKFRGEDGQNYAVKTSDLSYASKIQLLNSPALWDDLERQGQGTMRTLMRVVSGAALIFILYWIAMFFINAMLLWAAASVVVPETGRSLGRALRGTLFKTILSVVVAGVSIGLLAASLDRLTSGDAGDMASLLVLIAIGLVIVLGAELMILVYVYEISFLRAFLLFFVLACIGAVIQLVGTLAFNVIVPPGYEEVVLDRLVLRPIGLL